VVKDLQVPAKAGGTYAARAAPAALSVSGDAGAVGVADEADEADEAAPDGRADARL
jgi:hypothetical protein